MTIKQEGEREMEGKGEERKKEGYIERRFLAKSAVAVHVVEEDESPGHGASNEEVGFRFIKFFGFHNGITGVTHRGENGRHLLVLER
jgi:hypothetical protein